MSRNSEHLSSVYNSDIRLRLEQSKCHPRFQIRDILSRTPLAQGQYVSDTRITPDYRGLYFNIQSRFSRELKVNRIEIWNGYHNF